MESSRVPGREAIISFKQKVSDAPDHLQVSVRLPAAQQGMMLRSRGPCPPTDSDVRSQISASYYSKDMFTLGSSGYRRPKSRTRFFPRSEVRGVVRCDCPASQETREALGLITP